MGCVETMELLNKKELVKLVSFMAMGDGGLYLSTNSDNSNASFIMNMKEEHGDYILFCKSVLEMITSVRVTPRKGLRPDQKPQLRLETRRHPFFTTLHRRIYVEKYKGLDPHALKLLDAQALAILYMCDGSLVTEHPNPKKGLVNPSYNVTLNLKRLSYGDQLMLKKCLKDRFDLEWNVQRQYSKQRQTTYYYLRLRTKDVDKFFELIAEYVFHSFRYKLKEEFRTVGTGRLIERPVDEIVRASP